MVLVPERHILNFYVYVFRHCFVPRMQFYSYKCHVVFMRFCYLRLLECCSLLKADQWFTEIYWRSIVRRHNRNLQKLLRYLRKWQSRCEQMEILILDTRYTHLHVNVLVFIVCMMEHICGKRVVPVPWECRSWYTASCTCMPQLMEALWLMSRNVTE